MTANQIAYWNLQETKRSNLSKERETNRSNVARELETKRSNVANEIETHRTNVAKEAETRRSNVSNEGIKREQNKQGWVNLLIKGGELMQKQQAQHAKTAETIANIWI